MYVEKIALLDDRFSEWGSGPYKKQYRIGEDEVDKLLKHGRGWLSDHPEKAPDRPPLLHKSAESGSYRH
ncbi:MAG: hypothetical protein LBK43_01910 [Treponema sp.]|nr:hypothetical protein [Treponema sp.]